MCNGSIIRIILSGFVDVIREKLIWFTCILFHIIVEITLEFEQLISKSERIGMILTNCRKRVIQLLFGENVDILFNQLPAKKRT